METWIRHPQEDVLEEYVFRRLRVAETAPLEEHLLACESCQTKLLEIDEFVFAMKTFPEMAGVEDATSATPVRSRFSGLRLGRVWLGKALHGWQVVTPGRAALAGAMAILCIVAIVDRPRTPAGSPVPVTLTALRGGDPGFSATAPAGRPLTLAIEVPDMAPYTRCRVEMVDNMGRAAWSGSASVADGRLAITAPVALGAGLYWVRLYTGGSQPAREFGLRLE